AVASSVDEDASAAIGLAEFLREVLRIAPDQHGADAVREGGDVAEPGLAVERDDDVEAFRSGSLHPAGKAKLLEEIAKRERGRPQHRGFLFGGIEVEHADIRLKELWRARCPHVRRDAVLI